MKTVLFIITSSLLLVTMGCSDVPPVKDDNKPPTDSTGIDSTSHNFTFYVDTLGDGSSSVLFDVAMINDTLIYTVGEIFKKDSTGDYINPAFAFLQWNSLKWDMKQVYHDNNLAVTSIRSILHLNDKEIYFATGSIYKYDVATQKAPRVFSRLSLPDPNATIEHMWGIDSKRIYGVGDEGTIVYYDGSKWTQIATNTKLDFKDIWGDKDPTTGEYEIFAVASNGPFGTERIIYRINGGTATEISKDGIQKSTNCIWFKSQKKYYTAGGGMWKKDNVMSSTAWQTFGSGLTPYFIHGIRGQSENDIVAVGSFGELLHYNGKSWKSFRDLPGFFNLELYAVDIKGDVICAVGNIGSKACVVRGYRK